MNVYVSVDMEGITGIVSSDMTSPQGRDYERGRKLMTADTNAAIEGLVQAGAGHILVNDSHGPMRNLIFEDMHAACHLITGSGDAKEHLQLEAADARSYDAAVFVGYHAMAKTSRAIAPHTIVGSVVGELRINGRPHGETGLNAAVLGSLGIPVVLVTGDAATALEARLYLGDEIETVTVKEATGRNAAICRPPSATLPEITEAAARALENRGRVLPYVPDRQLQLEIDVQTLPQAEQASRVAGVERIGPLTLRMDGGDAWEQYRVLWAALRAAVYEPSWWLK